MLLSAGAAAAARKYGLKGCKYYRGEDFCISFRVNEGRAGTVHGELGPGCATNAAARPDLEEGTELSFVITRGKVSDLAFHLSCLFELTGGVSAADDVADLTLHNARWKGVLGARPAGPISTLEGQSVWIVVEPPGSSVKLIGASHGTP